MPDLAAAAGLTAFIVLSMPGRSPPYQPDDPRTEITQAAERQAGGEGAQDDQPASDSPARPEPAHGSRPLSDADALEVEAVRRRQLLDAFLHGASRPGSARSGTGRGLLIGIAVAIAIALCVGLVAMVQATMAHGGSGRPGGGVVTVRTAV